MTTSQESPHSRRIRLENSALKSSLNQSINIDDQDGKLNFLDRNYWSVVGQQEALVICSSIKPPYPKTNLSLVIESDFVVHMFCSDVKIDTIVEYNVPKHITDQNTLKILTENKKKMDTEQQQTKSQNMILY